MLKLTHNIWVMVDSTTDSDMPDMPTPPPSPRPLRLPALRSPPNIALMSQLSRRSSPPESCIILTTSTNQCPWLHGAKFKRVDYKLKHLCSFYINLVFIWPTMSANVFQESLISGQLITCFNWQANWAQYKSKI